LSLKHGTKLQLFVIDGEHLTPAPALRVAVLAHGSIVTTRTFNDRGASQQIRMLMDRVDRPHDLPDGGR